MEPSAEDAAQQLQQLLQEESMFSFASDSHDLSLDASIDDVVTAEEAEMRAHASPRRATERAQRPDASPHALQALVSSKEDAPRLDSYSSTEDLGNWALMKAASRGEDDRVEELLTQAAKANVNSVDPFGWTPLIQAAHVGALRICRILLDHGADARMETRDKEVALHHLWRPPSDSVDEYCYVLLAMCKQSPKLCNVANVAGETALHKLCLKGDRPTVAAYLKCTAANINAVNNVGETPLFYAVKTCKKELVGLLLHHGADPTASTREGTALTLATRLGYVELARLLAEAKFGAPLSLEKSLLLRKFGVSPEEKILVSATCGEKESLTVVNGRMFVTASSIFFFAEHGGTERKLVRFLTSLIQRVIPLEEVSAIEKRNSSMVLPNAIQIYTRIAKYFFAGFENRNVVFDSLNDIWVASLRAVPDSGPAKEKAWEIITPTIRSMSVNVHGSSRPTASTPLTRPPSPKPRREVVRDECGFPIEAVALAHNPMINVQLQERKITCAAEWKKLSADELLIEIAKRSERLRALVFRGVPEQHRGELWWRLSGARTKAKISSISYLSLVDQPSSAISARDIEKDLGRTFPDHPFFQSYEGTNMLRRVLIAYSARNPALGYCQGMNFLAAFLLLWAPEEQAFWLLCFLVEDVLPDHFGRNMIGSMIDQKVLIHYMQKSLPRLHAHLIAKAFPFTAVTTSWLCCLFVNSVPKFTALRFWDLLFMEGIQVVFLTALAIFRVHEYTLLHTHEVFKMVEVLRNGSSVLLDADVLIKIAIEEILPKIAATPNELTRLRFNFWLSSETELSLAAKAQQISRLKRSVKFSAEDLQVLYQQYHAAVLNSFTHEGLDIIVFHEILTKLAPKWDESFLNMELLFEGFDSRGDQVLDFEELINGLNVLYYGTTEQKLRLYFRCYDRNRDDYLTGAELRSMMQTLCSFLRTGMPSGASRLLEWEKIPYAAWQGALGDLYQHVVKLLTLAVNGRLSL